MEKPVVDVARERNAAYIRVTQALADRQMDTQMDRWMDRHCATIRASLACASRANRQTYDIRWHQPSML